MYSIENLSNAILKLSKNLKNKELLTDIHLDFSAEHSAKKLVKMIQKLMTNNLSKDLIKALNLILSQKFAKNFNKMSLDVGEQIFSHAYKLYYNTNKIVSKLLQLCNSTNNKFSRELRPHVNKLVEDLSKSIKIIYNDANDKSALDK